MWTIKQGTVQVKGLELEREFLESADGIKLIFRKCDGPTSRGMEIFGYQEDDLAFELIATRVDQETLVVGDRCTAHLGIALQVASNKHPISFEHARSIASNIKDALMTWRYPRAYAEALTCYSSAQSVEFNMAGWDNWNPTFKGRFP
jgi:hypothetical protein